MRVHGTTRIPQALLWTNLVDRLIVRQETRMPVSP